nr:unnamed protein product [Digitaria exilis]
MGGMVPGGGEERGVSAAAACETAARVLGGDASGDAALGEGREGSGEVARGGGLYEVEAAAAEWVTELWAATSGRVRSVRHRAAPRDGRRL